MKKLNVHNINNINNIFDFKMLEIRMNLKKYDLSDTFLSIFNIKTIYTKTVEIFFFKLF